MPLSLSGALKAALGLESTSLCTLWQIERRDGTIYYYTDHDQEIVFGSQTYLVGVGYNRNAVEDKSDMSVDEMNVQGVITLTDITKEDIRGQRFDGAEVTLTLVDYKNLGLGGVIRRKGWFGELKQNSQGEFDVELRGLTQALSEALTQPYTPACPVDLGSTRCGVPLGVPTTLRADGTGYNKGTFFRVAGVDDLVFQAQGYGVAASGNLDLYTYASPGDTFTETGGLTVRTFRRFNHAFTVVSVTNLRTFIVSGVADPVAGDTTYFNGGLCYFQTGDNNAIAKEISSYTLTGGGNGQVSLYLKMPFTITPGDTGLMYPACNKSIPVCKSRFNNVINFQGYPHVPGDKYLKDYPDAK